jgi:hypothetical protein
MNGLKNGRLIKEPLKIPITANDYRLLNENIVQITNGIIIQILLDLNNECKKRGLNIFPFDSIDQTINQLDLFEFTK